MAKSTLVPSAPPYPPEANGIDQKSFCEAKRLRGGEATGKLDGSLARESRHSAKRTYQYGAVSLTDLVDTLLGAGPRPCAFKPCVPPLGPVLGDQTSERVLPPQGTGSRSCVHARFKIREEADYWSGIWDYREPSMLC